MIQLTVITNPFEPWRNRVSLAIPHRPGITLTEAEQSAGCKVGPITGYRRVVSVNGIPAKAADQPLQPGDTVVACHVPAGPLAAAAAPFIAGAGATTAATMTWSSFLATVAFGTLVGVGIGAVVQALTPKPKYDSPTAGDDFDNSASYGWDPGANQSKEGIPVPVLYGTRRITPPVIATHTSYDELGNEVLSVLLSLAEGGRGAGAGGTDAIALVDYAQDDTYDAIFVNDNHYANYLAPGIDAAANDDTVNRCTNGTASASSYQTGFTASNAFDENDGTQWIANSTQTGWLQYNLGTGVRIKATKYSIHGYVSGQVQIPGSWDFQGSNDGTNWTTLDSRSGETPIGTTEYTITGNTTYYQYYRLGNIVSTNGVGSLACGELRIYGAQLIAPAINVDFKAGTNAQTVSSLFPDTYNNTPVGKTVDTDWFTFQTAPGSGVSILGLFLVFPDGLYALNASTGALENETVEIAGEYRTIAADGTPGSWTAITAITGSPWTIIANATSAYRVYKAITGLSAYRYDVRVKFNTTPALGRLHVNRCIWEYLQEGVTDDFRYPNTALLAIQMTATNVLSGGFPRLAVESTRPCVLVNVSGTWTAKPATNPAWICYDLLTHPRYGGNIATPRILLSEFQAWADHCDNLRTFSAWASATAYAVGAKVRNTGTAGNGYYYEVTAKSGTGTSGGTEPTWPTTPGETVIDNSGANQLTWTCRLNHVNCNIYFDAALSLRDALNYVSQIGRASIIMRGTSFGVAIDGEAGAVQLFTAGNIKSGSFREEFMSRNDLVNAVEVTYFDADRDYARQTIQVASPDYDDSDFIPNVSQVTLYGCTDRLQAEAHGRFLLACNQYLQRLVTIEADIDAIACQVGDVVHVQHPVPSWGLAGGRTVSATSNTIVLDQAVTLVPAITYHVLVRHPDDTLETAELEPVSVETTTATLTLKSGTIWNTTPVADSLFAVGQAGSETKAFRVLRITRAQTNTRKLTLIEYNALVYA